MMMFRDVLVVRMPVAAVSAAFGLESGVQLDEVRSEATKHVLDDMVRPDAKKLVPDLRRQMPVSQMPGEAHELLGVVMPDFDDQLRRGSDPEPSPVVELQAIAVRHCDRLLKIEQDVFPLIDGQADATAMSRLEVERERAHCFVRRPMPGGPVNQSAMKGSGRRDHVST